MKRTSILAHRGLFLDDSEKNSRSALKRAIDHNFGIETDIRDLNGSIIISHDPPQISQAPHLDLEWLLEYAETQSYTGRLALNIKSDGLSKSIEKLVKRHSPNIFVFDMSVPDAISYINSSIAVYTRSSEFELYPPFLEMSKGVWIDSFGQDFSQVSRAAEFLEKGYRATIVSPELHQRGHTQLWEQIYLNRLHLNDLFELCTDFPTEAADFFCE
jgi:hypothetical protein